ncbi:MAG: glycosyltransferase family 39 protein [Actinomycetota bacterium]
MTSATPRAASSGRLRPAGSDTARRESLWGLLRSGPGLVLLTLLAGLLRGFRLGAHSLWVDEFATLQIVSLPPGEILTVAARVNFCPPLYFWLVHGVVSAVGVSEASLRFVSAASGTLTIPVAWFLTKELTGSRTVALLASVLLALNPLHIWYSQEARAYALLVLLSAGALLFLVRATRTKAVTSWAGFVACSTAALLTHTTGPVFLAVAWLWALLSPRRAALLRPLAIASAVTVAAFLPFALAVVNAVARAEGTHSPARPLTGLELPYTLFTYAVGYSFGPSMREIQNLGPVAALRAHPVETALGVAIVAWILCAALLRRVPARSYFLILLVVPVAAMLLGSGTSGKAYHARYALVGLLGYCGLAAGALRSLSPMLRAPAAAAVLTLCAWADLQWYFSPSYWKDDSRTVVGWLGARLPPGSTVAVAPPYVTGVLSHYARLQQVDMVFVPADSVVPAAGVSALLMTRLHHVADPAALRSNFRRRAGPSTGDDRVGGYSILWRTTPQDSSSGVQR